LLLILSSGNIRAENILVRSLDRPLISKLDKDLNVKLGGFGLAWLHDDRIESGDQFPEHSYEGGGFLFDFLAHL
jgi:hypothetical protein